MLGWWPSRVISYFVSFLYPLYQSTKAIASVQKDDDTQWLVYWVIVGFFSVFEGLFGFALAFVPFFFEIKIGLLIWLQFPTATKHGSGAQAVYHVFIEPTLKKHDNDVDKLLRSWFGEMKTLRNHPLVKQLTSKVSGKAQ